MIVRSARAGGNPSRTIAASSSSKPARASGARRAEVNAAAASPGVQPIIVGHSSGAVVALEALVAAPGHYSGAVLYEPPLVLDTPLGAGGHLDRARAELDRGKPGNAFAIFLREIAGIRS